MIMWNLLFFFSRGESFPAVPQGYKTQREGLVVHLPLHSKGGVGGRLPASPFRPFTQSFQTPSMALGTSFIGEMMGGPLDSASSSLFSTEIHEISCVR